MKYSQVDWNRLSSQMMRLTCVAGLALASGPLAVAQDSKTQASTPTFKVTSASAEGHLVRVPVNKAVVVEFTTAVKEARCSNGEVAEVAAISPTRLLLTGKSFGTTQLICWTSDSEQKVFDVAVDVELDRLIASIRDAVPRAQVKAHSMMDAIVLTGKVPDAEAARKIMEIAAVFSPRVMNQMHVVGTQQVLLRCTVAEVNRRAARQLGFNGWLGGDDFRDIFFLNNLNNINPSNVGAPAAASFTGQAAIPFVVGEDGIPVTGNTTISFGFPRVQMQIFVQALRENTLLKVLAEPNLVTMSGNEASFLAGGEFPVPVPQDQGSIGIEYREFGVRLQFTPAVLSEERIRLKVNPEVSEPDFSTAVTVLGTTVPGLAQRRVDTVVELGNGQTFAIGGLLSERVRAVARGVPALGDVPVIGALFRSTSFQADESELVILVTPELVEPVSSDQITYIPGANYVEPNDFELFLMGQIDGKSGKEEKKLQPRINQAWPARASNLYGSTSAMKLRGPVGPAGAEGGPN